MRLGKRQLQELLYFMILTRKLESAMARLHLERQLLSPLSLEQGFEALAVGAAFVPGTDDTFCSSLPSLGSLIARGVVPRDLMAWFLGRGEMESSGRDIARHFADPSRGIIAPASHAGTHLGVMAGVAFAQRYSKTGRVAVAVVCEEAVATGDFHEAVNFAAVRRLPLVVLVARRAEAVSSAALPLDADVLPLHERVRGYGIAGLPVDGNELVSVLAVVETALTRVREGEGPMLVEASVRDATALDGNINRTPAAFAATASDRSMSKEPRPSIPRASDPLALFELYLREQQLLDDVDLAALESRAEDAVRNAQNHAESAPAAGSDALRTGVFADISATSRG